jgi:hypothetical protein
MGWYAYMDGARVVCERPGLSTYVLNGGRQTRVLHPPDGSGYFRLWELPYGAPSWLPASAWLEPEPKPFVPVKYHFEIDNSSSVSSPVDVTALLATVSPEIAGFLTRPSQCPFGDASAFAACFEVTTAEARDIAAALEMTSRPQLQGRFRTSDDLEYVMAFVPYLPHGTPVWCCGG